MWSLFVTFLTLVSGLHVQADEDEFGTFWYYTDINVDMMNEIKNSSGLWGNYTADTSPLVAFTGIEKGNDEGYAENKPDFVIYGGGAAHTKKELTHQEVLESLAFITHHLKNAFDLKDVPLFPVYGRYDSIPLGVRPFEFLRTWCTEISTFNLWGDWIQMGQATVAAENNLPLANFPEGCYHSMVLRRDPKILLLGVNSPLWQLTNLEPNDTMIQFAWFEKSLQWARDEHAKVIIISHIPPGTHELKVNASYALHTPYNDRFVELIQNYSDVISTVLSGYEHLDTFRVILDKSYHPVSTILLAPSMNPKMIPDVGSSNPRIRQYKYSRRTGCIHDYRQFWLDLEKPRPSWNVEYVASDVYGFKNLSARSMATLLDSVTAEDNKDGIWDAYWKYQLGGRPHVSHDCPKARSPCRCRAVCSIRHLDTTELEKCRAICKGNNPRLPTIRELENRSAGINDSTGVIIRSVIGVLCVLFIGGGMS
ncbi:Acid sphingomyelinase phosphodiesterase 3a [Fasciola gigantica]|uniref:Acid sphingomyelinase phosphodiesterase 3a n=1 Tax=Fasciola gigantica TaxID=46835 RepID=A0A504YQ34_FASGI|nr:Acid sphingomyelinase phosphodiesterase 3a [Fasciola gigantica]